MWLVEEQVHVYTNWDLPRRQPDLVFDWLIFFYLVVGTSRKNSTHEGKSRISWDKSPGLALSIQTSLNSCRRSRKDQILVLATGFFEKNE